MTNAATVLNRKRGSERAGRVMMDGTARGSPSPGRVRPWTPGGTNVTGYPFPPDRATPAGRGIHDCQSRKRKRRTFARRPSLTLPALMVLLLSGCGGPTSPIVGKTPSELQTMLASPDANVQSQGALGLSKLGPAAKDAVPSLVEALKSPSMAVRQNAALALGTIGPDAKAAVP